jgi:hypothetical protein
MCLYVYYITNVSMGLVKTHVTCIYMKISIKNYLHASSLKIITIRPKEKLLLVAVIKMSTPT